MLMNKSTKDSATEFTFQIGKCATVSMSKCIENVI